MSAASQAYKAAEAEIARVIKAGGIELSFDSNAFRALETIPPQIAEITGLKILYLNRSNISDIAPLQTLTALQDLDLNQTKISDIAPLQALTALQRLYLHQTNISDSAPLQTLTALQILTLDQTNISDIAPLQALTALQTLTVSDTNISDITPLQALTALKTLTLDHTNIADIAPLQTLTALQDLYLEQTNITDLRPIQDLEHLGTGSLSGLRFSDTPATRADAELKRLSEIEDDKERADQTRAYLKTLPPYPAPLPWEAKKTPEQPPAFEPVSIQAILTAQSAPGWRFSPSHAAMVLYVSETPEQAQQSQLARVSAERLQNVINALGDRINAGGLRQEAFQEAQRFADILADTSMSLSERSLDLWASLISLGNISESNHQAGLAGRDPLDLLPPEAKSALSTFMAIAGNLVRSFDHIKEMDDGHASFSRTQITPELVLALLDRALSARFVDERSAGLVQHVANEAHETGKQSEKALSATQSGGFNLLKAASVVASRGLVGAAVAVGGVGGGVVAAITSDIGTDISDHYELGEKAIQFLESSESEIQAYIEALPADQAAQLRHEVQTTLDQKKGPR